MQTGVSDVTVCLNSGDVHIVPGIHISYEKECLQFCYWGQFYNWIIHGSYMVSQWVRRNQY